LPGNVRAALTDVLTSFALKPDQLDRSAVELDAEEIAELGLPVSKPERPLKAISVRVSGEWKRATGRSILIYFTTTPDVMEVVALSQSSDVAAV